MSEFKGRTKFFLSQRRRVLDLREELNGTRKFILSSTITGFIVGDDGRSLPVWDYSLMDDQDRHLLALLSQVERDLIRLERIIARSRRYEPLGEPQLARLAYAEEMLEYIDNKATGRL
ncbi:MAG: hypothetical protein AAFV53_39255 [Myxococcota bacterium]